MIRSTLFACLIFSAACSTTFEPKNCALDSECSTGSVCDIRESQAVCVPADDATLVIGQGAPASGNNQALGTEMRKGILLAFNDQNAAGGIRGRKIKLEFRDDSYDPTLAEEAVHNLLDIQALRTVPKCPSTATPAVAGQQPVATTGLQRGPNAVLALIGNVGTPTMVRTLPLAVETGTVFFGAFTGAETLLRDDKAGTCAKFIFNVRASYKQEARATMQYFGKKGVITYKEIISFDQNDSFGQAGYDGIVAGFIAEKGAFPVGADATNPIRRFRYTRNDDTSVPAQAAAATAYIASVLQADATNHTIGVMMTDTYGAGSAFIQALRRWQFDGNDVSLGKASRLKFVFSNVSFVGPNALADSLKAAGTISTPSGALSFTQDVLVSQSVPNYQNDSSEAVTKYKQLLGNQAPSFTSLEGYIAGRIFVAGMLNHKGPFTAESLISAFETLPELALGLGGAAGFSPTKHQYLNSVWGTAIEPDGSFRNLYFWSDGRPIQYFE